MRKAASMHSLPLEFTMLCDLCLLPSEKKILKIDMKNSLSGFRDFFCSAMKIYPNHLSSSIMNVITQCTAIVVSAIFCNHTSLSTNTTTAPQVSDHCNLRHGTRTKLTSTRSRSRYALETQAPTSRAASCPSTTWTTPTSAKQAPARAVEPQP